MKTSSLEGSESDEDVPVAGFMTGLVGSRWWSDSDGNVSALSFAASSEYALTGESGSTSSNGRSAEKSTRDSSTSSGRVCLPPL